MPNRSPSKDEILKFLNEQVETAQHSSIRDTLIDAIIEAARYDHPSPLATLRRTIIACGAILNGEAAHLSRKLGEFQGKFREDRSVVNSATVDAYIRLRYRADITDGVLESEWIGPRAETLRRDGPAHRYLVAMQDAQKSSKGRRKSSHQRELEEIIGQLDHVEDRQLIRAEIASGTLAKREHSMLKNAIARYFPTIDQGDIAASNFQNPTQTGASKNSQYSPAMAALRNRLQDNDQLRHFNLQTDGKRLKTTSGQHVIPKEEYGILLEILGQVIGT